MSDPTYEARVGGGSVNRSRKYVKPPYHARVVSTPETEYWLIEQELLRLRLSDRGRPLGRVPEKATVRGSASELEDPLTGANCSLCGATADNFHVSDDLWERVGLGHVQACFKCFRIAAWHAGVRLNAGWEVCVG